MNILFLTTYLSPYRVGWCEELGKTNRVTILYTDDKVKERNSEWVIKKSNLCKLIKLTAFSIMPIDITYNVIKYLSRKDYEVVIVDGYSGAAKLIAILYMRLNKIPFYMNVDGGFPKTKENLLIQAYKKFCVSSATYYLSSSKFTDQYLIHYGAKEEKIFHHKFSSLYDKDIQIEITADADKVEIRKKLGIRNSKTALTVGRFLKLKQIDMLIRSWEKLEKDFQLLVVGEGDEKNNYIKLIHDLNLNNVHLIDFKKKDELIDYYKAADLFVLPTKSDVWGLVVNEAMAFGLPVITTDQCIAGLELVKDYENGFILSASDEEMLASRISEILSNDELRIKMAQSSLEKIKEYTIENMAKIHMKIFSDHIRNKSFS